MGKVLSWVLLVAVGYLVWKVVLALQRKSELARRAASRGGAGAEPSGRGGGADGAPEGGSARGGAIGAGERMVACRHCGVYVPESEAIAADGGHFCSAAHRDAERAR
jgi:hypothetical protein